MAVKRLSQVEERLRDFGLFSLEKSMLREGMIAPLKYLQGCHLEEGGERFHLAAEDRTRSHGFKLCVEWYQLDIRGNVFTVRVVQQWTRLPKEVVSSLSLAIFKQRLDRCLSGMLWADPALSGGLD